MSIQALGLASEKADGETVSIDLRGLEAAQRSLSEKAAAEDINPLALAAREQLARDIADIEKATAALRRAEPGLETWIKPPAAATTNPRPLWLLIGALWLSTAIVTAGAVVAIATLAG